MLTPNEENEWFDAELMPIQNVEDGVAEEFFGDVGEGNDFGQMRAESFEAQRKLTDVDWEGKPYTGQIYPDDPDLDRGLADRNQDGKVSSWERALGNQVAKGTREWRQSKDAEFKEYVKAGAGFGAGLALFQVSIIGIALLAGMAKK